MPRTRIKFCGITRVEDARAAAECGADAIGLLLHSTSDRRIDRETAHRIIAALPPFVTPIGLFVDAPPELIVELSLELGLRHVQLQGHEPPSMVAGLRGLWVIKAVQVERGGALKQALDEWRRLPNVVGILLETAGAAHGGGSGVENDWRQIAVHKQAGDFEGMPPIIAAGGLRPDNVASVITMLYPWAVDVASGIESSRGIKSREKMLQFAESVRSCDR